LNYGSHRLEWRLATLACLAILGASEPVALGAGADAPSTALAAVEVLREGGCGGLVPAVPPLHHNALLDHAAEQWAGGTSPAAAASLSGYNAQITSGLHVTGPESSLLQILRHSGCRTLTDKSVRDIGQYRRGFDTWLLLAAPYVVPSTAQAQVLAARALQLVNEARARGARCGDHAFGPAPPVRLSGTLAGVALGHATDMAKHDYFEHEDREGHSPADRVRAIGYREALVGENIAYGPQSAEEVVNGWLESPGHCENIMDPRFAEMGIAYAAGQAVRHGLYWVQLLAEPRV
jgi:uncharacterized protein YkwD